MYYEQRKSTLVSRNFKLKLNICSNINYIKYNEKVLKYKVLMFLGFQSFFQQNFSSKYYLGIDFRFIKLIFFKLVVTDI